MRHGKLTSQCRIWYISSYRGDVFVFAPDGPNERRFADLREVFSCEPQPSNSRGKVKSVAVGNPKKLLIRSFE